MDASSTPLVACGRCHHAPHDAETIEAGPIEPNSCRACPVCAEARQASSPVAAVDESITRQPLDLFIVSVSAGLYSDQEIAGWIRANSPTEPDRIKLIAAVQKLRNRAALPALIRNAVRSLHDLPPIEGEFEV
jgi:hypothetical protein